MSATSPRTNFPLRRPAAGLAEIETLLDRLPGALMIVEKRSHRVLFANAPAAELTGYSRAELGELAFKRLFPHLDEVHFWGEPAGTGEGWELSLVKSNKTPVEVQATRTDLAADGKWSLVALTPLSALARVEAERRRSEATWEKLRTLVLAPHEAALHAALDAALQAGADLTGADCLVVYQAVGESLELRRSAGWGLGLPDALPSAELGRLRSPHLWLAGKRASSALHRAAQAAQFSFLASAPLGQRNALIGLVAAGGDQLSGSQEILPSLHLLAGVLTTVFQHHAQLTHLQASLQEQARAIKIYEAAQEAVQEAVIVLTPQGRILRLNLAAERTLGYTSQEVRGQPVEYILIGSEGVGAGLASARHGVPTYGQQDVRLYRRSGQAFLAEVEILPVTASEAFQGIVVVIRDQSEREQIQAQAQQLEQRALLGEVTAVFAHEVRNPINNLSTGLQLMAINLPENDPNQEIIARLQGDCDRLAELMKSVLQFARPTDYEMEPVDLGVLVARLIERMRPKLARANIKHHVQIEQSLPHIYGNPRALEQVFTNLVTNALQAMGESAGTLAVKVQAVHPAERRGSVQVRVADSGPGIPKELQDRIFQPFFTTKSTGTGLGLAITKRIITAHKGTIQVKSFPGGTVFQVELPEYERSSATDEELELG